MKKNPNQVANDLLAAMAAIKAETIVPKGWYSMEELAKASGLSRPTLQKMICDKIKAGTAETRKFKPSGSPRPVPYYHNL